MPTFVTPGPISAAVKVAGARVRVAASERADTVVLVEPIDGANPSDVKVAESLRNHRDRHRRGQRCLHRRQQRAGEGAQLRCVAGKP